jgi:endo-1,4-beta-xylanase
MKTNSLDYFSKRIACFLLFPIITLVLLQTSCSVGNRDSNADSDTTTSLCKVYEPFFKMGVAINPRSMMDSVTQPVILKNFNSITAENAMKWEMIHPKPGEYNFAASDSFVDFGEKNNMYIVGHVLVWHSQTPEWVFQDASGKPASKDTLLQRMQDHIKTIVGRYRGRVDCWDVVNEAVDDNGEIRKNIWYNIAGIEYVQKAFKYAHEADPEAVLIYNDYSLPSRAKREAVVKMIGGLKSKGVKIDVIGMQGHYHLDYPTLQELDSSIVAFSKLGCKIMFTELDINVLPFPREQPSADVALRVEYEKKYNPYPDKLSDSMQTILANRYAELFSIFLKHADKIDRVTIWGLEDGGSWLNYWPIRGRSNYPLLFDRECQPKPAFWALVNLGREYPKE